MSDAPLVTVVIPTYNHARLLAHALQSVRTQTFTNWEAVVVNNYSADDTVAVVEACADPRIRLENFRNNGVIAASRNRGISLARGKYIAFLDSDDVWYPQKLAKCIERIESGFDMVCHAVVQIEGARRRNVFCGPERAATFDA
jgi:glycosyltransferase involved in cell wall biosynthesis